MRRAFRARLALALCSDPACGARAHDVVGGITGRMVTPLSFDDASTPPKTSGEACKLVEQVGVPGTFGTALAAAGIQVNRRAPGPRCKLLHTGSGLCGGIARPRYVHQA